MITIRGIILSAGLVLTGVRVSGGAEPLIAEHFEAVTPGSLAGQGGWSDNSKMGAVEVVGHGSLSAPNHVDLSAGGAVHHALESWDDSAKVLAMEFAFKRGASAAGRNLQISLWGKIGKSVLFLNLRGFGKSLDVGPGSDDLKELVFTEEVPKDVWFRLRAEWSLSEGGLQIKVISEDGTLEVLNEKLELPVEVPVRIVVGSTSSTAEAEAWAVDDLVIEAKP